MPQTLLETIACKANRFFMLINLQNYQQNFKVSPEMMTILVSLLTDLETYYRTLRQNARSNLTKTCFWIMLSFPDCNFKRSINREASVDINSLKPASLRCKDIHMSECLENALTYSKEVKVKHWSRKGKRHLVSLSTNRIHWSVLSKTNSKKILAMLVTNHILFPIKFNLP